MCQIPKVNLVVNAIGAILFLVMGICLIVGFVMNQSIVEELQQVTILPLSLDHHHDWWLRAGGELRQLEPLHLHRCHPGALHCWRLHPRHLQGDQQDDGDVAYEEGQGQG